ncbi:glycosyltransferase [Demequina sediminis]|uniref:glycosyltransferase n=1 Tax=Demequina sediminis TaxID=1930058 RepID=UPI002572C694|nr:glycosyltransferase [Demequina sediminis]
MPSTPDIAVVVTTHREGRHLIPTMRGLARTVAHARRAGRAVEVVVVRDRADARTVEQTDTLIASGMLADAVEARVIDVDHGDLGLSRNAGIALTSAPMVGILDADNLPSENWLDAAARVLDAAPGPSIVHPARLLKFGDDLAVWPLVGTDDPRFHAGLLAWFNMWDAFALMHRAVAVAHPYRESRPDSGFGPEDWAFNCDTVAAGIPHLIVPETTLYYHARRHGSLAGAHAGSLVPRTALLRDKEVARAEVARLAPRVQRGEQAAAAPRLVRAARRAARLARATSARLGREMRGTAEGTEQREIPAELTMLTPGEIADWHGAHLLQPLLRTPVERHLVEYRVVGTDYDALSVNDRFAYWSVIDQLPERLDFLFVALWVRTGGGDRMTLKHLHALRRLRPDATVALITTEPDASEHLAEVPDGVTVVELGRFRLWPQFTEQVLAMVCAQLRPETIHINNSVAGFWALQRFGRQIARHSRVYLQTFCVDRFDDLSEWSFLYNRPLDFFDHVTGILTDSQAFVDQVIEVQGVPRELFTVFTVVDTESLAPALVARGTVARDASGPTRLLWAGRFDFQKRLDRLADISVELRAKGAPVEIVVKGRAVVESDERWQDHLTRAEAGVATVEGPYEGGFVHARPEQFDALLLNSDYEGVPMVMLEAMAVELPVIAPLVGGVGEMLDETVGYPVDPGSGLAGYLEAIEAIRANPSEAAARARRARERVERAASLDAFDATLEALPGYLPRRTGPGRARAALRYFASPKAAERLARDGSDIVVYTGSNGHSNFGDVLQTKNILAGWQRRSEHHTTLIMPAYAALPAGRAALLESWYPADAVVFATTQAVEVRGTGLVEIPPPAGGRMVHVVGGGYLNARWGGEHFPIIDALAHDAGEVPVLFSGLQIDRPALDGFVELARHHRIVQVGLRDHVSLALAREHLDVPVEFTFDDLTEIFQDWARAAVGHERRPGPTRVAVHMNTSDYAGGERALAMWRSILHEVAATLPGCELTLLHAYDDARLDVRDTLDTVTALAEDMPFSTFTVLDIAKASLEYRFGEGLPAPLRPILDVDLVLSSSYHTALFGALMGKPAYLMGASEYFRQKAQLFRLPELSEFLAAPGDYLLDIPEELAARAAWLERLATLPESLD